MSEKYWDVQKEVIIPKVMRKFNIAEKELKDIHLKVLAYKM